MYLANKINTDAVDPLELLGLERLNSVELANRLLYETIQNILTRQN